MYGKKVPKKITMIMTVEVRFSEKGSKSLHKFTSEKNNKWLENVCLAWAHF